MVDSVPRKKPSADFVVRLVGSGIRPWAVPMRSLAKILDAVQRLVDQKDDDDDSIESDARRTEPARVLHLVDVKSSSAAYTVAAPDPGLALRAVSEVGLAILDPDGADWPDSTLSSLQDLSAVAKSLGCEIEFRDPKVAGKYGDVLAKITPSTYDSVASLAFIHATTSVYAKILRIGGATEMRCGIRLPGSHRKMVFCKVANKDLVRELGAYMYEYVVLSGTATWLRRNWHLKRMTIKSFEPPKTGSILEALRKAHDAGGHAWDRVEDPDAMIAEMRKA